MRIYGTRVHFIRRVMTDADIVGEGTRCVLVYLPRQTLLDVLVAVQWVLRDAIAVSGITQSCLCIIDGLLAPLQRGRVGAGVTGHKGPTRWRDEDGFVAGCLGYFGGENASQSKETQGEQGDDGRRK